MIGTPGHSIDHVTYSIAAEKAIFSGDVLFQGSVGRTDLPGSDPAAMYDSLTHRLGALPEDTVLFPGHNYGGASSTIGDEKRHNAFMRFAALGDFLRAMGRGR